ncbi:MAG: hypothetical protein DRO13_05315 [Thermoprotei archaeon]|nr:MAG: hypothetical protein DRO13_05315 [Thermoprotei archaeon]
MKKLYRNTSDKMVCGVCSGIAEYVGIDPTLARLAAVVLLVLNPVVTFVLYIAACIIIPKKPGAGLQGEAQQQPSSIGGELSDEGRVVLAVLGIVFIVAGLSTIVASAQGSLGGILGNYLLHLIGALTSIGGVVIGALLIAFGVFLLIFPSKLAGAEKAVEAPSGSVEQTSVEEQKERRRTKGSEEHV